MCRHDHVSKAITRTDNQSLPVCDPDSAKEKPDGKYHPELSVNSEMRMTPTRVTASGLTVEETVVLARHSDLAALRAASFLAYVEN